MTPDVLLQTRPLPTIPTMMTMADKHKGRCSQMVDVPIVPLVPTPLHRSKLPEQCCSD
jgi:hypothetical protein